MKFIHLDEISENKLAESRSGRLLQTSDFRDRAQCHHKFFTPGRRDKWIQEADVCH